VAKIKKFTEAERARIWRRRLGWTQVQTAKDFGISRGLVIAYETGKVKPPHSYEIGEATVAEHCFIKRERANVLQRELAVILGCSVQHVRDMETGRVFPEKLRKYWKC
jgi:transcriptional regulator with XRE-family HTH domain